MRADILLHMLASWAANTEPGERGAAIAAIGVLAGNLFRSDLRPLDAGDLQSFSDVESLIGCLIRLLKDTKSPDRLYPRRLRWGAGDPSSPRWRLLLDNIEPTIAATAWRGLVDREGRQSLQCPARDFRTKMPH